jgi:hypothetical protein
MCKDMPAIPVIKVVDPKRIIGKNGGQRRIFQGGIFTPPISPRGELSLYCLEERSS